jgi:hypothetical protein
MRELAVYGPTRKDRSALIELEEHSNTDFLALLTAIETCVGANVIRSVQIKVEGERYTLAPR